MDRLTKEDKNRIRRAAERLCMYMGFRNNSVMKSLVRATLKREWNRGYVAAAFKLQLRYAYSASLKPLAPAQWKKALAARGMNEEGQPIRKGRATGCEFCDAGDKPKNGRHYIFDTAVSATHSHVCRRPPQPANVGAKPPAKGRRVSGSR